MPKGANDLAYRANCTGTANPQATGGKTIPECRPCPEGTTTLCDLPGATVLRIASLAYPTEEHTISWANANAPIAERKAALSRASRICATIPREAS